MPQGALPGARIELRGWGWRHAGRRDWALRGVDLVVEPGERVLLLGPSGAGKSTLLAALAGLPDPDTAGEAGGALLVDGQPPREVRLRTGVVLQDPETQVVMARSGDDVAFGLENRGIDEAEIWPRVRDALATVGFPYPLDRSTSDLSGGEKQRLAIAGVLACEPALLLLDEPTANLDPAGAALVRGALGRLLERTGATTVLVEHRVGDALPLVDRVVVLAAGGGVVADGPPDRVFVDEAESLAAQGVWLPHRPVQPRRATAPAGPEVVAARDVAYRYPGAERDVREPYDLTLHAGEATVLTGPNGSGKSTLAMLVAGLRRPSRGEVLAVGRGEGPLHRWRAKALSGLVGTVFQEPEHQFLTRTVRDELALGLPAGDRGADALMERLRLSHLAGANPFTLSGGEKRRLSVATALTGRPQALVLDEPTFGQDASTWAELLDLLAALRDQGTAVLAVSHDLMFAECLADREIRLGQAA